MLMNKNRVLLFVKVPPPLTGATIINKQVVDSELLKEYFTVRSIQISYSNEVSKLGKINLKKILIFIKLIYFLIFECVFYYPKIIYFQLSPLGKAFYRDLLFIFIIKIFRIKILFHLHGKGIKRVSEKGTLKIIYKFAFSNSEVICLSQNLKSDISNVYNKEVHILNNGIPNYKNTFKERDFSKSNDLRINILFLSNLLVSKGIIDFLSVMRILDKKNIEFNAFIVGAEGDMAEKALNVEIDTYNLQKKVKYLGPKYDIEKHEIFEKSDILIYPTYNDAFPLVLLEAMIHGLPIIASNEGAISEIIINEVTGFIVNKGSPDEIVNKIEFLLKNPELFKSFQYASRARFIENYTIEQFEMKLIRIFLKVSKIHYLK